MSLRLHYEDGPSMDISVPSALDKEVSVSTTFKTSQSGSEISVKCKTKKRTREIDTSMQESPPRNRRRISNDRSNSSNENTQNTDSSKTSDQESTSKGKDCKPFWNDASKEWSKKLWSCTKTGCVDLDSSFWSLSSHKPTQNSWFSTTGKRAKVMPKNSQTTCSQSPRFLWQDIMENEQRETENEEDKPKVEMKARKIRVYPTQQQKNKLMTWFGVVRKTYNWCVDALKNKLCKMNQKELRKRYLHNDVLKEKGLEYCLDVPYDVRDESMRDFLKAYKISKKKKKISRFKFRSRKDRQQSFVIWKRHWGTQRGFFSDIFSSSMLRGECVLPDDLPFNSRFLRTRLGHYYICIPCEVNASDNQAPCSQSHGVISLDPGVRTFMTGYDADGVVLEFGAKDMGRLVRLGLYMDDLQSRMSKLTSKEKYRYRKAFRRMHLKIRNLVDDMHKKLVHFLCKNYRVVLLPEFKASSMVLKGKRTIGSRTVRSMLTWSHYRFRQRILNKEREFPWCKVVICDEAYTSKTCGRCGTLNNALGSSKTFVCNECESIFDRDANGARNILLRYLTNKEVVDSSTIVGT